MSSHIDMTMKTYDKEKFLQIMINKDIKKQLDLLKSIISNKKDETFISYGEVINFLIDRLKNQPLHYTLNRLSIRFPIRTKINSSNNTIMKTKLQTVKINT
ncbi:MAG: hypothetical protein IH841_08415 [Thaumarchaeota archaeon]|nr:hypothetical protein [Nitrososphaerota archaeon]